MAARKRTQEEKNLRTLRELASLPANKQCFDCHQRGPTYVNMLVGSFVCTSCSGMLRGLNPPHRVKSITMTVFTPEEVEFVRSRGNEYCRQVWLGLYDPRSLLEPESRDEQKVKDFMIQKYERKRWYVNPETITFRSQQTTAPFAVEQHGNSQPQNQQPQYPHEAKSATTHSAKEPGSLVIHSPPQAPTATWVKANSDLNYNSLNNNNNNISRVSTAGPPGNKGLDLLTEFGADPFAPCPPQTQVQHPVNHNASPPTSQAPASQVSYSSANGNFANFESAFSDSTSSGSSGFTPEAAGNVSFAVFQNNVISPPPPILNKTETSGKVDAPPSADRYAALADLDNLFHAQQDNSALSSANGPSPPPTAVPPAPTSVSSAAPWAMNNSTSTLQMKQIASNNYGQPFSTPNPFQAAAPSTDSWNSVSQQPHPTAQKQQQPHMYNPFQQQQQQQQHQGFVYNPYTGAPAFNNVDNYGPMGTQHGMFNPYLVGAGQPPGAPTGDMGPQYVMQNGGGGGPPFSPGPWSGTGHTGAWMQPLAGKVMFPSVEPHANPFMTNTATPKLNPGNPFL